MKSLSKLIVILLLAGIGSTKLNAQNAEIRTIDSLINHYKDKKLSTNIDYSVFKHLNIYTNQANNPTILKHLDSCRKDSIPMVRRIANNFIFLYSISSTNIKTAKTTFRYMLESSSDKLGRGDWADICSYRSRFSNEIYSDIEIQKAIIKLAQKDIVGYADCFKFLVDKSRTVILDFAKEHYTPLGKKYIGQNEKGTFYYRSVEWYTLIALGSRGEKDAIAMIINKIEEEKDFREKLSWIRGLSTMVGGREIAKLFYKYYMDDNGLQKTADEPSRGGGMDYGHYYIFEYLEPRSLFLNPLTKEEETEVRGILDRKIDNNNESERNKKEMDYILFFRKWLTKNKPNWKILNEN